MRDEGQRQDALAEADSYCHLAETGDDCFRSLILYPLILHPSSFILHPRIPPPSSPTDLRNELAALHFDAIKIRTFRGALARVLDPAQGLPGYLGEIRAAAGQFAAAAAALSATEMARVAWPSLPTQRAGR